LLATTSFCETHPLFYYFFCMLCTDYYKQTSPCFNLPSFKCCLLVTGLFDGQTTPSKTMCDRLSHSDPRMSGKLAEAIMKEATGEFFVRFIRSNPFPPNAQNTPTTVLIVFFYSGFKITRQQEDIKTKFEHQ